MNIWAIYIGLTIVIAITAAIGSIRIDKLRDDLKMYGRSWEYTTSMIKTLKNDREIDTARIQKIEDAMEQEERKKKRKRAEQISEIIRRQVVGMDSHKIMYFKSDGVRLEDVIEKALWEV